VDTVKVKLTIAYDGANYAGWQVQKTGLGVQQKIEEALGKLFGAAPRLHRRFRAASAGLRIIARESAVPRAGDL